MKLLLDTHTVIWWWTNRAKLSAKVSELLSDADCTVYVSAATAWEMATKVRLGKMPELPRNLPPYEMLMIEHRFEPLAIGQDHALLAGRMAGEHRDPFDRMLAAQAMVEAIPIASNDDKLDAFGCQRIWG